MVVDLSDFKVISTDGFSPCLPRCRNRLIEILNTGHFEPPMIVFVNQKKGADVLMKDLLRAQVRLSSLLVFPKVSR